MTENTELSNSLSNLKKKLPKKQKPKPVFPFTKLKGEKGAKFRQKIYNDKIGSGTSFELETNGFGHLKLLFKSLEKNKSGNISEKRIFAYDLNIKAVSELLVILHYFLEEELKNNEESYHSYIIKNTYLESGEKLSGAEMIYQDVETADSRMQMRESRSHLIGLFKRFIELCDEDDEVFKDVSEELIKWGSCSEDKYSNLKSQLAQEQLELF